MATAVTSKEEIAEAQSKARKEALEAKQKSLDSETNAKREGKGTRRFVGMTRGKNPQMVEFEQFDESKPDTLPSNLAEFVSLAKITGDAEKGILANAIIGWNEESWKNASDPIAEYVDSSWPEEIQKNFRTVVRNYSVGATVSIEDAVALIRPGIVAAVAKSKETAK